MKECEKWKRLQHWKKEDQTNDKDEKNLLNECIDTKTKRDNFFAINGKGSLFMLC